MTVRIFDVSSGACLIAWTGSTIAFSKFGEVLRRIMNVCFVAEASMAKRGLALSLQDGAVTLLGARLPVEGVGALGQLEVEDSSPERGSWRSRRFRDPIMES